MTIPEDQQDKTLPDKLEAERAGILRWMVEGCLLWQKEGLQPPEAVLAATAEYRNEMDTVGAFLDECCFRDPELKITSQALYQAYSTWIAKQGDAPMSKTDFGSRLGEKGFRPYRSSSSRGWEGLGIVPVTG